MTKQTEENKPQIGPGLPGDAIQFKVLNEIGIIAGLADTHFSRLLPKGVTTAQFGILNHLLRLNRQETIGELAHNMQVSQPTMSSTVKRMAEKGMITFVPDPEDGRIKRVAVTEKGSALRNQSVDRLLPEFASVFSHIPEERWADILPMLTELRIILDRARDEINPL